MSSQDSKLIWQMLKLWQMHEFAIGHRHLKDGTALHIFHLAIRSFLQIREVTLKKSSRKCTSVIWHLTTWRKSLQLWILRTNYSIILYATWMSDGSCNICSNIIGFLTHVTNRRKYTEWFALNISLRLLKYLDEWTFCRKFAILVTETQHRLVLVNSVGRWLGGLNLDWLWNTHLFYSFFKKNRTIL